MPRVFLRDALVIQHPQVQYESKGKVPDEGGKRKVWRGFASCYLDVELTFSSKTICDV